MITCCCIHNILLLYDRYDDWKESIGYYDVENAVDGVIDVFHYYSPTYSVVATD